MFFARSLRAKTLLSVLIPTALGLMAVAMIALYAYDQVAREVVQERDTELVSMSAARVSEGMNQYVRLLQSLASTARVQSMKQADLSAALREASDLLDIFDAGIVVYDEGGVVAWSRPLVQLRLGKRFPDPSEFEEMRRSLQPTFSDIFSDEVSAEDVILIGVPVVGPGGEFGGAVAGLYTIRHSTLAALYGEALKFTEDHGGYGYLVDGEGRIIYHPDSSRVGAYLGEIGAVTQALEGETGAALAKDSDGETVVYGFAPVPGTGWGLVAEERWDNVVGPIRGYSNVLLALVVTGGIASGVLIFFTIGRVLRPIRDLTQGAQRVASGDFDHTITAETGDEVEALAEQFNTMARALKQSYQELERKVTDRTRELAALNAVADVVSGSLDLQRVLGDALAKTLEVTGIEAGGIYLLQEGASEKNEGVLTIAVHQGLDARFVAEIDNLDVGEGFSGRVVKTGKPLVVRDLSKDSRLTRAVVTQTGFRSAAVAPLTCRERVWGSLFLITRANREFSVQDMELLSSIGQQIGVAIENARFLRAEQRRAEQFRVMSEVGRQITSILDVDELLREIVRLLKDAFGYYQVTIGLVEGDELVFKAGAKTFVDGLEFTPPSVKVGGEGITAWVAGTGEPLLAGDVSQEPRYLFLPEAAETRSELAVPLKAKERVIGVLNVESDQRNAFDRSDLVLLQSLANQAAVAIENARLFNAEQRRAEQFRVISEVGRRITSVLATDELLNEIVRLVKETFEYHLVGISLIEDEELVVKAGAGPPFDDPQFEPPRVAVGGKGITAWVASTGERLLVPDVRKERRYLSLSEAGETCSELCVPLKTKDAVIGVLNVESDQVNAFDESDLVVLQSLAGYAAIALEEARLFDAEQRRAEQFRLLSEVGARITSLLGINELLSETARLVNEVLGYYLVGIGLVEGDDLVVKAGAGPRWQDPQFRPPRFKVGGQGIAAWVAATGEPLLARDVREERRYLLLPDSANIRSELAVPLKSKSGVIGVLDVQSDQLNAFDESDLTVLQSLANLTAIAIEEARLFAAEQRRAEQFRAISEVGGHMTSILAVDELLTEIVHSVRDSLGYYHTAIGLVEGGELVIKAGAGAHWENSAFKPSRLKVGGQGITAWVAAAGEPLLVPDVSQDARYLQLPEAPQVRSELAVPLRTKTGVIGVLDVQSDRLAAFDESDLVVLQSLSHQAAIAIENARLYEQAQQAAVLEERSRLARELHDAVTQTLFSASLIAEVLPTLWESDPQEGRELLKELRQLSRGALAEMRTLLLELRPAALLDRSLEDLLDQLGEGVTGRTGVPVEVSVEGKIDLPSEAHVSLYRVAQEALNNVVKHAHASRVEVCLRCLSAAPRTPGAGPVNGVELRVRDDGCGFDASSVPPDRLGLGIIRERAQALGASVRIVSQPGQGTEVIFVWKG